MQTVFSRYSDALDLRQDSKIGLHKLCGNRSLAYIKAQRYHEAIADAERCIELAPQWPKGYWRLGMALLGLKQTLQAIQAFAECWRLDHSTVPSTCQFHVLVKVASWQQSACVTAAISCLHTRLWGFASLTGPDLVHWLHGACLQVHVHFTNLSAYVQLQVHA